MEPDDLYGLPLDRFVAERGALAKALRADRRREEAKEVAGLRKPSVAAWAVNQLVRTQDAGVGELLAAGDALRSAQEDLLAGKGDARALRAAGERERAAVDALVEAARGLLTSGGLELSDPVAERVADTLHAAALDEDARQQVQGGRLLRGLRHVGLGLGLGEGAAAPAPAAPARSRAKPAGKPGAKERKDDRKETARAERARADKRAERERAAARKEARAAETAARRRAERAARALGAAEERRKRAAEALAEAEDALATARQEAEAAVAEQAAAQTAAERAG